MLAGFVHLVGERARWPAAPALRHRGPADLDFAAGCDPCTLKAPARVQAPAAARLAALPLPLPLINSVLLLPCLPPPLQPHR